MPPKLKKIVSLFVLSAYLAIGVGVDSVLAMCFESNGDVVIENVSHNLPIERAGFAEDFFVKVIDSGKPYPLDPTNNLHRDFRVNPDSTKGQNISFGKLLPPSKIVLFTVPRLIGVQSVTAIKPYFTDVVDLPALALLTRETTVLQL